MRRVLPYLLLIPYGIQLVGITALFYYRDWPSWIPFVITVVLAAIPGVRLSKGLQVLLWLSTITGLYLWSESPRVPWRPVGLSHAGTAACVARCR
jgi:hypothetical protein